MLPRQAEVVIVGGGVMGASTAWHLARRGQRGVVLLERQELFGMGATGRCAGGVRLQFATEVNVRLSLASLERFERFEEELGQAVDYRPCGYLFLLTREPDVAAFRRHVALQRRLGAEVEWWDGDEVRRRLPAMELADVKAATFGPRDGLVDPNGVVQGYVRGAREQGAVTQTGVTVTGVVTRNGRVVAVETDQGDIATPVVVDAAGPWAAELGRLAGVDLPIAPVRRQLVVTTAVPGVPQDLPFVIDFARSLYWHREGDGVLTGMSDPDQPPGLDESVDPAFEERTLEASLARMPALAEAGIAARWAGLYEVTPDAHPIFGATPLPGFFVVGGFSGHGFMHGPVAGQLMAEILQDGRATTVDVSALDLARFRQGRLVPETNVV